MKREFGFTLIELMFAVGLTALLLGIAGPAMSNLVSNSRQTGVINNLVSSMHMARSSAIMTNSRVTICTSADGNNCAPASWNQGWIVFSDRNSDQTVGGDEPIIAASDDANGLTIESDQFGRFLMYRPNGRVMNAAVAGNLGEFTICDNRGSSYAKVLIIDLSGRPRTSRKLSNGSAPVCS